MLEFLLGSVEFWQDLSPKNLIFFSGFVLVVVEGGVEVGGIGLCEVGLLVAVEFYFVIDGEESQEGLSLAARLVTQHIMNIFYLPRILLL